MTERQEFRVIQSYKGFELREYLPCSIAEVKVSADYSSAGSVAFRSLFGYISQGNKRSEKIAMTAPVVESSSNGVNRMAFMLPSEYKLDNAPRPTNPAITLKEMPVRIIASIRYSGRWTDKNVAKYKAKLEQHLAANKVDVIGEFSTAVYNAPFTPPFMRRNEIHYEISALPER